jgi:lactoylglutathione lyase
MTAKIEHVAMWTVDLERLRDFYETFFGAQAGPKYKNPSTGFQSYFLRFEGEARLEIMQAPGIEGEKAASNTQAVGLAHLAFSVGTEAQVDALTARLQAAGFPPLSGPRRTGDGYYESVVLDPDRNRVEITAGKTPPDGAPF